MSDKFTCAQCGGRFGKKWTDEEADAEYERAKRGVFSEFSKAQQRDRVLVCDDCYEMVTR